MFVVSQHFPVFLGGNFVGSVITIILMNIKQMIVYKFVGMEIIGQGLPTNAMNIGHSRTMMIPQYLMYIHIPY